MKPEAWVISLKRTPERLKRFHQINGLEASEVIVIEGVDGFCDDALLRRSRRLPVEAQQQWSQGSIGSALSHLACWQRCIQTDQAVIILEDDSVLAPNWRHHFNALIDNKLPHDWEFVLLGWNYDSVLRSRDDMGTEFISLFEPAYPDLDQIRRILGHPSRRVIHELLNGFGLAGYAINPTGARELIEKLQEQDTSPIRIGRGIPEVKSTTLDGALNSCYRQIKAFVVRHPLVMALNDQNTSLTKTRGSMHFGT
jgi:glycosyl transferase family 25